MFSYRSKEVSRPQTQTTTISKLNEKKTEQDLLLEYIHTGLLTFSSLNPRDLSCLNNQRLKEHKRTSGSAMFEDFDP